MASATQWAYTLAGSPYWIDASSKIPRWMKREADAEGTVRIAVAQSTAARVA